MMKWMVGLLSSETLTAVEELEDQLEKVEQPREK
jgi:hypothetical protein